MFLAEDHFHRLASAVGNGWLKRAERLLEELPESIAHGYLYRMATRRACEVDGDFERVLELAERTLGVASRFEDRDLHALALQEASALVEAALAETSRPPLDRARLLTTRMDILLQAGDLETARSTVDELEEIGQRFGSPALRAGAAHARGALQLREGDTQEALTSLQRASRVSRDANLPYETTRARMLLAKAFREAGNPDNAELELQAAQAVFEELGAKADLRAAP